MGHRLCPSEYPKQWDVNETCETVEPQRETTISDGLKDHNVLVSSSVKKWTYQNRIEKLHMSRGAALGTFKGSSSHKKTVKLKLRAIHPVVVAM